MPARAASRSTASTKSRCSSSRMNVIASPLFWQPKQFPVRMLSSSTNACVSSTTAQYTSSTRSVGLDRLHDPTPAMKRLLTLRESPAVLRQQEEVLDQVGPDEVHAVQVAPATVDADPALRRDAVGAHSQPGADVADELQVRTIGRVEHDGPVGGDAAVGREVSGQPPCEVLRRLVERRPVLEEPREVHDLDVRSCARRLG